MNLLKNFIKIFHQNRGAIILSIPFMSLSIPVLPQSLPFPISTPQEIALSPAEVNTIAGEITVRIDGPKGGSGFIVEKQGNTYYVLTNWHVVDRVGDYEIVTSDGKRYFVYYSLIQQLPNLDLALIPFSSSQRYRVAISADSNQIQPGSSIYVAGWPRSGTSLGQRLFLSTNGTLSERQQPRAGYSLVYTNLVRSGMSGGPILDDEGKVIGVNGIVQLGTNPDKIVSAGIPINYFLDWRKTARLSSIPTPPNNSAPVTTNRDLNSPVNPPNTLAAVNNSFSLATTITEQSGEILSLALSFPYIIIGNSNGTLSIWNVTTSGLTRTLSAHQGSIHSITLSRDSQYLVTGGEDGLIKIWDLATGLKSATLPLIQTIQAHNSPVLAVGLSPDGQKIASGSWDKTIKLWDAKTGQFLKTFIGHEQLVDAIAFSPDGKILASGSKDSSIKLWNVETGELIRTLKGHELSVLSLAISPDGETLASGSADGTIALWKLKTGQPIRRLSGHTDGVWSIVITTDGKTLISGSWDKTVKLWDLATGQLKGNLKGHSGYINAVSISPDGKTLVSGGWDGQVKVWNQP
ncbi:Vegetative incompatibility protein HET-E-1 [Planktothrix tepida]|uniref:WD-repeat protein n=1 Tax=Planktothrix tepida PCC 9214 TaxID=671072 RepID=A0A1J1LDR8_9CYAN|nr:trypsin-like peptidase domain-containing protein [Planktothrix tepida]CAD5976056.1 Vegetative incompatibility protein HET-E-1 [Planktothrix tepida]CUR30302.1 WD-repeat protein [Planktothrix tepida PCC 9214]